MPVETQYAARRAAAPAARLTVVPGEVRLSGQLDAAGTAAVWAQVALPPPAPGGVTVDATGVTYCDGTGIALLVRFRLLALQAGRELRIVGLNDQLARLVAGFDPRVAAAIQRPAARAVPFRERVGCAAHDLGRDLVEVLSYAGELLTQLALALRHPRRLRLRDFLLIVQAAGVEALPIAMLVGFLLGLILAFQAAVPLKLFGADIYVASMVGVAIIRELGPLMTAIVLTGRSGSAFAAEIGAMQVNDEIDALVTMGLEPVRVLAVPRVLAGTLVAPLLTVFTNLAGLCGGLLVMLAMGFPAVVFVNQVQQYVSYGDFLGGLFKAVVFGFLIAATGCLRGLQTGEGAGAVGRATTRSVVSGIVLIAVADGIFAIVFYCLGI